MSSFPRFITALFLAAIYTVITVSPLASLVMRSPAVVHAVTGECVGDCNICGCSAEARANHTCCCWRKKLLHDHERESTRSCCKKKQRPAAPVLACGCPCGKGKQFAFSGSLKYEHLPNRFGEQLFAMNQNAIFSIHQNRLSSRYDDPPDPPPRITI